ncbi:hypothetical protein CIK05_09520 [Bdellovibrio sp. qaytius]|nr:hypothetical protein CIK05_09520 [Bdellovibrio sp. qaytius]
MSFKNLLTIVLLFLPINVFAGGYSRIGIMYLTEKIGIEGSATETSRTLIDFGAGHLFGNGFTLGGMYGSEKDETATQSLNRTGIGPTIGYMKSKSQGFFILATYFINPSLTGGYKGTGTQIDLGYRFQLDKISIAPQFSKKTFKYTKLNDVDINPAYVDDRIDPYFVVWIDF